MNNSYTNDAGLDIGTDKDYLWWLWLILIALTGTFVTSVIICYCCRKKRRRACKGVEVQGHRLMSIHSQGSSTSSDPSSTGLDDDRSSTAAVTEEPCEVTVDAEKEVLLQAIPYVNSEVPVEVLLSETDTQSISVVPTCRFSDTHVLVKVRTRNEGKPGSLTICPSEAISNSDSTTLVKTPVSVDLHQEYIQPSDIPSHHVEPRDNEENIEVNETSDEWHATDVCACGGLMVEKPMLLYLCEKCGNQSPELHRRSIEAMKHDCEVENELPDKIKSGDSKPPLPLKKAGRFYGKVVSETEQLTLSYFPAKPIEGREITFECEVKKLQDANVKKIEWRLEKEGAIKFQGYTCVLPFVSMDYVGTYICKVLVEDDKGNDQTLSASIDLTDVIQGNPDSKKKNHGFGTPGKKSKKHKMNFALKRNSNFIYGVYDVPQMKMTISPYPIFVDEHKEVTITIETRGKAKEIRISREHDKEPTLCGSRMVIPPLLKDDAGVYIIDILLSLDNYYDCARVKIDVFKDVKEMVSSCKLNINGILDDIDISDLMKIYLDPDTHPTRKNWRHLGCYLGKLSGEQMNNLASLDNKTKGVLEVIKSKSPNCTCAEIVQCLQRCMIRNDLVNEISLHHKCLACDYFYQHV